MKKRRVGRLVGVCLCVVCNEKKKQIKKKSTNGGKIRESRRPTPGAVQAVVVVRLVGQHLQRDVQQPESALRETGDEHCGYCFGDGDRAATSLKWTLHEVLRGFFQLQQSTTRCCSPPPVQFLWVFITS